MEVSFKEAITETVGILSNIPVPAGLIEQIGVPICAAIKQLMECMKAMDTKDGEENGLGD